MGDLKTLHDMEKYVTSLDNEFAKCRDNGKWFGESFSSDYDAIMKRKEIIEEINKIENHIGGSKC